jgi:cysteine-rich repeat protein
LSSGGVTCTESAQIVDCNVGVCDPLDQGKIIYQPSVNTTLVLSGTLCSAGTASTVTYTSGAVNGSVTSTGTWSWTCTASTGGPVACESYHRRCGNGIKEQTEACDDGNMSNTDGCTTACVVTTCGDGVTQSPNGVGFAEQCDGQSGCKSDCTWDIPMCTLSATATNA